MPLGTHKATLFGVAGVSTGGDVVLLSTQTASGSASITFSSGIDSTYGEYIFKFYNINVGTDQANFHFQVNATDDPGGGYDTSTITSTRFTAYHSEAGDATSLAYNAGSDQANGTAFQQIGGGLGNGSDESLAGELHLFNPASTTYVKHFYGRDINIFYNDYAIAGYIAGYINDTTAIDDIQFKVSTGVFDGTIKMWGVKN